MGENLGNREPNLLSLFMQMESIQFRYLRHKQPSRGHEQQRGASEIPKGPICHPVRLRRIIKISHNNKYSPVKTNKQQRASLNAATNVANRKPV